MDPVSALAIAGAVGSLVATAVAVGQRLFEFCDGVGLASKEFEVFSQEVNTFASVWMVVQPCLRNPNVALSQPLLETLRTILNDTGAILNELQDILDGFEDENDRKNKVARKSFLFTVSSSEALQRKRLKKFINRRTVVLQRSRIFYATTTLNVVLAVIQHARTQPPEEAEPLQANNEVFLLGEQRRARLRVEKKERDTTDFIASRWLDPLPQSPSGRDSPFDVLARRWTRPLPQAPPGMLYDSQELRAYLNNMTEGFRQQIMQLERRVGDHERRRAVNEATIARLQADRDNQRDRDAVIMERMQQQIDTLKQADAAQEEVLQTLQQECKRLRTERNDQRTRRKDVEREYDNLVSELERVRKERNNFQKELDELRRRVATQRSMPPSSYPKFRQTSRRSSDSSDSSATFVVSSRGSSRDGRSRSK